MDIHAIGQHVLFGKVGHLLIILAFVSSIAACISYFLATTTKDSSKSHNWISFGRKMFILHAVSVLGVMISLLLLIHGHFFEYKYVWEHTSRALPTYYQFSAMWSGQEGSTLLWMFWHGVLGCVLIFKAREWESPVLTIVALAQVLLGSMLLGIYLFHYKFGSNPFALMRDTMDIPVFKLNPDWVPEDGTGLNPSLQNYWMVIHPPTLFLGFASCTIPAAFAIASLWQRKYTEWVKPVLPWSLFALMILGTGVLMGGAWAYEALSFGGFWAWDPVENASLVPWLVLAAGLHTLMAYKHTGYSLHATYLFFIGAFMMVLYSSFLTKSGILGDASVHSFTDMGMSGQLIVMIGIFLIPAIYLFISRTMKHQIPTKKDEEKLSSREFWLFIGSLVFIFAAVHITVLTSFPVINTLIRKLALITPDSIININISTKNFFKGNLAPPSDIKERYNSVQIWMAVLVGFGSAVTQFFKYRQTGIVPMAKQLAISFLLGIIFSLAIILPYNLKRFDYIMLAFCGLFAIFSNAQYIFQVLKGKWKISGGSVSHIGFAMMLLGILISQGKQQVLSVNRYGMDYGKGFTAKESAENVLLYKDEPGNMGKYRVTYTGDSFTTRNIYFNVRYDELDNKGSVTNSFTLHPNILLNIKMGNNPVPSTKKTVFSDLYTHITSAPLKEDGTEADSVVQDTYTVKIGDTIPASRSIVILESIDPDAHIHGFEKQPKDIAIGARLKYITMDTSYYLEPVYLIRDVLATSVPAKAGKDHLSFSIIKIIPEENKMQILVEQKLNKFIIMKAIQFPMINLLWLGCFVMISGIFLSLLKRKQDNALLAAR